MLKLTSSDTLGTLRAVRKFLAIRFDDAEKRDSESVDLILRVEIAIANIEKIKTAQRDLLDAFKAVLSQAELLNRDTDTVWAALRDMATSAIARANDTQKISL